MKHIMVICTQAHDIKYVAYITAKPLNLIFCKHREISRKTLQLKAYKF